MLSATEGKDSSCIWRWKEFGSAHLESNYLAFGNAILSLMLPIETPGIQISGEMRIGRLDSGRELIAKVYVGIEPKMVRRNYFHGFIDHATIRKILDAFDFDVSLPPILQDSSLPHGLATSFAFDDIELPGIVIHKGFKLNGTLTTMGFNLSAFIIIFSTARKQDLSRFTECESLCNTLIIMFN